MGVEVSTMKNTTLWTRLCMENNGKINESSIKIKKFYAIEKEMLATSFMLCYIDNVKTAM